MLWFIFDVFAIMLSAMLMIALISRVIIWSAKSFKWQKEWYYWVAMKTRWVERRCCFIQNTLPIITKYYKLFIRRKAADYYPVFKVGWQASSNPI